MSRGFPDIPPVWAFGFAVLEFAVALTVPLLVFAGLAATILGLALIAAGVGSILWAAAWFRRKETAIEPGETPSALITEGPYRHNRNPIYSGMTLALLGIGVWLGAAGAVLVALLFPVLITSRFVLAEERSVRSVFGADADRYFTAARRW